MSAMSNSMSLAMLDGDGFVLFVDGHSIALTRHRVTSRGGSFHTGPSRRLYAPDRAGGQAGEEVIGVEDLTPVHL